jgi:hypothetical protein
MKRISRRSFFQSAGIVAAVHFFQGAPHAFEVNNPDAALAAAHVTNLTGSFSIQSRIHPLAVEAEAGGAEAVGQFKASSKGQSDE